MKKKYLALLLAGLLAGCGGSESDSNNTTPQDPPPLTDLDPADPYITGQIANALDWDLEDIDAVCNDPQLECYFSQEQGATFVSTTASRTENTFTALRPANKDGEIIAVTTLGNDVVPSENNGCFIVAQPGTDYQLYNLRDITISEAKAFLDQQVVSYSACPDTTGKTQLINVKLGSTQETQAIISAIVLDQAKKNSETIPGTEILPPLTDLEPSTPLPTTPCGENGECLEDDGFLNPNIPGTEILPPLTDLEPSTPLPTTPCGENGECLEDDGFLNPNLPGTEILPPLTDLEPSTPLPTTPCGDNGECLEDDGFLNPNLPGTGLEPSTPTVQKEIADILQWDFDEIQQLCSAEGTQCQLDDRQPLFIDATQPVRSGGYNLSVRPTSANNEIMVLASFNRKWPDSTLVARSSDEMPAGQCYISNDTEGGFKVTHTLNVTLPEAGDFDNNGIAYTACHIVESSSSGDPEVYTLPVEYGHYEDSQVLGQILYDQVSKRGEIPATDLEPAITVKTYRAKLGEEFSDHPDQSQVAELEFTEGSRHVVKVNPQGKFVANREGSAVIELTLKNGSRHRSVFFTEPNTFLEPEIEVSARDVNGEQRRYNYGDELTYSYTGRLFSTRVDEQCSSEWPYSVDSETNTVVGTQYCVENYADITLPSGEFTAYLKEQSDNSIVWDTNPDDPEFATGSMAANYDHAKWDENQKTYIGWSNNLDSYRGEQTTAFLYHKKPVIHYSWGNDEDDHNYSKYIYSFTDPVVTGYIEILDEELSKPVALQVKRTTLDVIGSIHDKATGDFIRDGYIEKCDIWFNPEVGPVRVFCTDDTDRTDDEIQSVGEVEYILQLKSIRPKA